jgi:CYTH domain-containing protein
MGVDHLICHIRRRFLLASPLARLIQRAIGGLRQIEGFFPEQRDRTSWVLLEENRSLLVLMTAGPHGDVEEQTEIPVAHAHALLDVCAGEIAYTRMVLPIGDRQALIDQVIRPRVLHLVTVEFDHEGEARGFHPLPWFGPEVTGDARYTNQALALRGLDEALDVPLSDAALNSLLDTLENRFPVQPGVLINRLRAKQVPLIKAPVGPAQESRQTVQVNLNDVEEAMRREMERTFRNSRS